jgi:hypothetical protein
LGVVSGSLSVSESVHLDLGYRTAELVPWSLGEGGPCRQNPRRWLDINTTLGPDYGKVTGYYANLPTGLLHKTSIVFRIDKDRFLKFYVDLLTRPVPVKFKDDDQGHDDGEKD